MKQIQVIKESPTGLNLRFNVAGVEKSRVELVKEIRDGKHPDYHVAHINGRLIPRSNPDGIVRNNLG